MKSPHPQKLKMPLKVTIITPTLNAAGTLAETIESVIAQDYNNVEHIIIDGKSTDASPSILQKYADRIDRLICEPDNGLYDAMNKGIKLATGDIIATLNSDDTYTNSTAVTRMVNLIESSNLDAAYADLIYVNPADPDRPTRFWRPGQYQKNAFARGWVMPHPTFFCRRTIYDCFGTFNPAFRIAADFELMLRFVEKHRIKIGYLPETIVKMRTGGKANTISGIIRGNREIIRSFRLNGLKISPWFFLCKPVAKIAQLLKRPPSRQN